MRTLLLLLCAVVCQQALAQIRIPDLSPKAITSQYVGLTKVSIEYFRPSVRKRKVFDSEKGVLPYGQPWRTGANSATKITFSDSVIIAGKGFAPGSYTIISIPGLTHWRIQWYPYKSSSWTSYVSQKPIWTNEVEVVTNVELVETLEMRFQEVTLNRANLIIEWEYSRIVMPLKVNEGAIIMKSIEQTLNGPSKGDYFQAALYLHESGGDLDLALTYVREVTQSSKALFFQVTREALILRDLGKNQEALKSAERGLKLSKEAQNDDFIRINKGLIETLDK